jgi:uncharacterized membrane protein
MLFVKFLIILFFFVVATIVIGIALAFLKLKHVAEQLTGKGSSQGNSSYSEFATGTGANARNSSKAATDEDVYSSGNPKTTQRKIIPKDEGEYVDFEEVKE